MSVSGGSPRLFAVHDYVHLWVSNLLGDIGSAFATVALSVTAVVFLHASTFEVAVIAALGNGAYLVLGVPIGVWADRVHPKRLLLIADLSRFVAVATVPVAYFAHGLTVAQLMGVAAVTSAANVTYDVAHTTVLPSLVGRTRVPAASAQLQSVDASVRVFGPGLAGQLIAVTAGPVAYIVTAVVHAVSSLSAGSIRAGSQAQRVERTPFWSSLREGLSYVIGAPLQRTFMFAAATVNFGSGFIAAIQPLFILRTLHFSPAEYGLVLSVGGIGGIVGALAGMRIRRWLGEIRAQILCYAAIPLAFAPTPLAPFLPAPKPVSVAVAEFCISFVIVVAAISSSGIYARMTPPHLLGRVTAARRTVAVGVIPLGTLIAGALAIFTGYDIALWIGAGIMACSAAVFAASPIFRMKNLPPQWEYSEA
ncbi:MFS transporter [Gryllotalpicola reticulitermitis]|uniref:MFS transporter n=1 Tax=Gryllotalpicola reticulitermitis TaxID=1184153 RepID=A0ABV8QA94_9MICO